MRDQEELPYIVIERQSTGVAVFFWGVAIGFVAGVLLAPRSGAETQDELRRRVDRIRDSAESARESARRTRERLEGRIDSVREQLGDVRERVESGLDRVRGARHDGARPSAGSAAVDLETVDHPSSGAAAGPDEELPDSL